MSNQTNCVACDESPGPISMQSSGLVSKMFSDVTGLKVQPNYTICRSCQSELKACYNFKKRCHEIYSLYNSGPIPNQIRETPQRQQPQPFEEKIFANPLESEISIVKSEFEPSRYNDKDNDSNHDDDFQGDNPDDEDFEGTHDDDFGQYEDINPPMSDDDESTTNDNDPDFDESSARFECDECSKAFSKRSRLVAHKAEHRNERLYSCPRPGCNSAFNVPHRLTRHLRNVHDADEEEINEIRDGFKLLKPPREKKAKVPVPQGKVQCEICNKVFTNKRYLQEHLELQHLNTARYICSQPGCTKRFTIWSLFETHMKKHKGLNDFNCKFCGKGFFQRKTFNSHLRTSHQMSQEEVDRLRWADSGCEIDGNKCVECNIVFQSSQELFKHCASKHAEKQKFMCDICGKAFTSKAWLTSHQKYHKGIKSKKCMKCPSAFTEHKGLRTHLRRVHNMTDEEVYALGFGAQ